MKDALILNVDDNEVGRYTKTRLLRLAGYEVVEAANGHDALELARTRAPDLALLDVKLPDMDGFEVCRQIRSDPRTQLISVLQISASFVSTDDLVQGLEGGADGYLTTPLEAPVLLATIRALLRARRAEAEVARSQRMLNDFFENAAMGLQWVGRDGTILRANQAQLDLVGCPAEAYVGRNLADAFEEPGLAQAMLDRLAAGETIQGCCVRLRGCDNSRREVVITANVLWEDGRFIHARCFVRDVTDIRRMNVELRESQSQLALAMDAAEMGTWEIDLATSRITISERIASLAGLAVAESLDLDAWLQRVLPEDRERFRQGLAHASPPDALRMEYRLVRPDGSIRWVDQRGRFLLDESGRATHGLGLVMDITERKQAQERLVQHAEQLEEAKRALEEAGRAKDEFLATVSHELRTPLTAIVGWSKLLNLGKAGEPRHALEVIERSAHSLTQIVEDLLDSSRIITGKISLKHELTEVEPLVRGAMEGIGLAAQAKSITLRLCVPEEPIRIWCDPSRVRQIIWNLLTNAVKFTPIGGEVSVSACAGEGKASIVVTDSGPGISAEFLPHLFGRFRQADASTTRRYGGLGLGLAISKQLVELHGGTIRAENQTDRSGATFSITFPLAAESAVAAAHHPEQSESLPPAVDDDASHLLERLRGLSLVLVDDDPETCAMASRSLAESGVDLRCAYTAEDAFALLVDKAPDVLISDISMPVTDGYELIRRVRGLGGQYATMPCVALTAMARREDAAKALAAGFNAHLPKPFDPLGLASMLAGWAPDRNAPSAPAHILLAEDNPDIAELLRATLEECGYSVSSVASVREAATVAERRPVDLLISDLRLSDGTGWDLMSRLRQTTDVLGIAMSGYSDPTYVEESRASGFSDYLVKPVEGQRLLDSVARLLKGR